MTIPKWFKPGLSGAAIGAIVLAIVGFSAGWVVSHGTAYEMAQKRADKAVLAALTPICVAQFKNATVAMNFLTPDNVRTNAARAVMLAALRKEDSWNRFTFVEKYGWATMPGKAQPAYGVARACANELLKLMKNKN